MTQSHVAPAAAPSPQNAPRDLLARLYREIGISAVAAALEISHPRAEPERIVPVPTLARDKAA